jgi:type IV pilus assembly protein PilQ
LPIPGSIPVRSRPFDFFANATNVNLPAAGLNAFQAGQFSFILFNSGATRFLNLELSALEADGKGKIIASPRVLTADQVEAVIEQGTEIPYQQATSSGATAVTFRKANLALKVKPQITPDGNVIMTLDVNKDQPGAVTPAGVAINTKHVKTEVLVENGGTVVIGGIFEENDRPTSPRSRCSATSRFSAGCSRTRPRAPRKPSCSCSSPRAWSMSGSPFASIARFSFLF